jgi:hypothetical protein
VRLVVNALRRFGVLHKDKLRDAACAENWHQGGFDAAVRAAVRARQIDALPCGFYAIPHPRGHLVAKNCSSADEPAPAVPLPG